MAGNDIPNLEEGGSMPPLVDPSDVKTYPGGPFSEDIVTSAGASVRSDAGWHIAPVVRETIEVYPAPMEVLFLPTMKIKEVHSITDPNGNEMDHDGIIRGEGIILRKEGWPKKVISIDLSHGYEECPPDLIPVIASRCQASGMDTTVSQEASATESIMYTAPIGTKKVIREISRYGIPYRP